MMQFQSNCVYCRWERDHDELPRHWTHPYVPFDYGDITKTDFYKEILDFLNTENPFAGLFE